MNQCFSQLLCFSTSRLCWQLHWWSRPTNLESLVWSNPHHLGSYYQEWMPRRDGKGNINGKDHFLQVSGLVWWTDGVQWINNDAGNIDRIFAADAKNEKLVWMWRPCELQLSVKPDCSFRSHLTLYNWAVLGKDVPDITQRKDDIETGLKRFFSSEGFARKRYCWQYVKTTSFLFWEIRSKRRSIDDCGWLWFIFELLICPPKLWSREVTKEQQIAGQINSQMKSDVLLTRATRDTEFKYQEWRS